MNVLLVDDQERILVATKKLVNWERLGVGEVYTADSAAAARKILETYTVDMSTVYVSRIFLAAAALSAVYTSPTPRRSQFTSFLVATRILS